MDDNPGPVDRRFVVRDVLGHFSSGMVLVTG